MLRVISCMLIFLLLFPSIVFAQTGYLDQRISIDNYDGIQFAINTKDYQSGNNITSPSVIIRVTYNFEWSSFEKQNIYTKVLSVTSFLDGIGFGEEWTQLKDWSYISENGKELHCGVEGKLNQFLIIQNFKLSETHHSISTKFMNP